ncbi:MAG: O-antigen ligase family protein [Desulfosudaceae bacterium]
MILVLMGIFIFFNPFPHTTTIKEITFYLAVLIVLLRFLTGSARLSFSSPLTLPFAIYVLWSLASLCWSIHPGDSLHDWRADLLELLFVYYVIINYFHTPARMTALGWILIVSTGVAAMAGIFHFYVLMERPLSSRLIILDGGSINARATLNALGVILSVFYLLRSRNWLARILSLGCLSAALTALALSYSRAALLALVVAAAVALLLEWKNSKKKILILLSIFITIALAVSWCYLVSSQSKRLRMDRLTDNPRLIIYRVCLAIIQDHPLTGTGFAMDTFRKNLWPEYSSQMPGIQKKWNRKKPASSPHNFVLDLLVRLGLTGAALFGWIIFRAFHMGRAIVAAGEKNDKNWGIWLLVALSGMLTAGLFGPILDGPNGYNLYILLAMMTIVFQWSQPGCLLERHREKITVRDDQVKPTRARPGPNPEIGNIHNRPDKKPMST